MSLLTIGLFALLGAGILYAVMLARNEWNATRLRNSEDELAYTVAWPKTWFSIAGPRRFQQRVTHHSLRDKPGRDVRRGS